MASDIEKLIIENDALRRRVANLEAADSPAPTGWYNVLAFGALGDGSTDDTAAIQAACDAAETAGGGIVYFPRGTYTIPVGSSLSIATGLTLMGGAGVTIQTSGTPADTVNMIQIDASGVVLIQDIEFLGPADNNSQTTIGVLHLGTAGKVRFERCKFSKFSTMIKSDAGATAIEVIGCEFDGNSIQAHGILHSGTSGSVFALNCDFHDLGASDLDHGIYAGFGNALDIRSCSFRNIAGYGVHPYSGSGTGTPLFVQVRDCYFYECGMLTSAKANTLVETCTFNRPTATDTYALVVAGTATIRGCRFEGGGCGISQDTGTDTKTGTIIENCTFNTSDIGVNVGSQYATDWLINSNNFTGGSASNAIGVLVSDDGNAIITGNLFAGEYDYGIRTGAAGKIVARNNKFTCTGMGCMTSAATAYTAEFYDNDFQPTGSSIRQYNSDNAIYATGNYLGTDPYTDNATTARMSARAGLGANVASGNSITLTWNADTYHITGTTTIDNIYMPGTNGTTMFCGRMVLIFDSTAALGSSGNIIPQTTSARTAGEAACLTYDPVTATWYEIGW